MGLSLPVKKWSYQSYAKKWVNGMIQGLKQAKTLTKQIKIGGR